MVALGLCFEESPIEVPFDLNSEQIGENIDTIDVGVPVCDRDNPNSFKWSPDIDLSKYEPEVKEKTRLPKVSLTSLSAEGIATVTFSD